MVTLSRRSRWYWLLALAFHLPLLVTLAPLLVRSCSVVPQRPSIQTLVRMRCFLHRYYRRLFVIAGLGVGLELLIGPDWLSWTQPIQVGICCYALWSYASQTLSVARPQTLDEWVLVSFLPHPLCRDSVSAYRGYAQQPQGG